MGGYRVDFTTTPDWRTADKISAANDSPAGGLAAIRAKNASTVTNLYGSYETRVRRERYDALIDFGFSEDQATHAVIADFRLDGVMLVKDPVTP